MNQRKERSKIILFKLVSKNFKYLEINLTIDVRDIYHKIFKTLRKKPLKTFVNVKNISCSKLMDWKNQYS